MKKINNKTNNDNNDNNDFHEIKSLSEKWNFKRTKDDDSSDKSSDESDDHETEESTDTDESTDNDESTDTEAEEAARKPYRIINPTLSDKQIDQLILQGISAYEYEQNPYSYGGSGGGSRMFKNPDKKYRSPNFKTTRRPFSPSPKRKDYEKIALTKASQDKHARCTFILPETNQRCKLSLGIYPQYCHLHTMLIENLVISKSKIKNGGNGLFAGPHGFKKGMIIGEYSKPWMEVSAGRLDTRNGKKDTNYSYVYCDEQHRGQKEKDVKCWDGLDARSTIVRNSNDAHGSKFKNNAYFDNRKDSKGNVHVYMIASRNIGAFQECYCDYGQSYWN